MAMVAQNTVALPPDSDDSRRYNRIKRWLGIADFGVGLAFLLLLLGAGWSGTLRDLAYYRVAAQN